MLWAWVAREERQAIISADGTFDSLTCDLILHLSGDFVDLVDSASVDYLRGSGGPPLHISATLVHIARPHTAVRQSSWLSLSTSTRIHNMFRRPGTGPSKASATTLCQKCLQRGHYSYECKAKAQDRPYKSRPSRTQQLLNPSLKPKLTTEVPNDLVRNKGVADDILKKKEEERARTTGRKRSRSRSRSSSADSVSTISTNRSPSRSPPPRRQKHDAKGKRSRRSVSIDSRSSLDSRHHEDRERNTRRRVSSFSPEQRGRQRRSREGSARKGREGGRSKDRHGERAVRRMSTSRSRERSTSADRMDTADDRTSKRAVSRSRSRLGSPRPQQRDRSPSPYSKRRAPRRSPSPRSERNGRREPRAGGRNRFGDGPAERNGRSVSPPPAARQPPPAPRERSLSPFSKRVALTRAMNTS